MHHLQFLPFYFSKHVYDKNLQKSKSIYCLFSFFLRFKPLLDLWYIELHNYFFDSLSLYPQHTTKMKFVLILRTPNDLKPVSMYEVRVRSTKQNRSCTYLIFIQLKNFVLLYVVSLPKQTRDNFCVRCWHD